MEVKISTYSIWMEVRLSLPNDKQQENSEFADDD